MARLDYCVDFLERDNCEILESEGVEFLLSAEGKVPLPSSNGKTICLFFSASWCRPCKDFMPLLVQVYKAIEKSEEKLEIIYVSSDHGENEFRDHFKSMPWLAVPYNPYLTRCLSRRFNVNHIPSLIPLISDGYSIEENAVDLVEDYGIDAFPFTRKRREELKAIDDAKRRGVELEKLLAHVDRDYFISGDGTKILVSEVTGKTIGLYFGAYWCPPSRSFTNQLAKAYNDLIVEQSQSFEVIFVSADRDEQEFEMCLFTMPWLAIPYEDKTLGDLRRIFDIKSIPSLVLLGANGKTISTNGRSLVSLYGASAFPFTDARIKAIKAGLEKEGERLPRRVLDPKHEHNLKLDMAKAYVCDACKKQGRFWTFSCDSCDYDLHPTCLEESL